MLTMSFLLSSYLHTKAIMQVRDRECLLRWQDRSVQTHLKYVLPRSQFYRLQFSGYSTADWHYVPTIDKFTMMRNFDSLNTIGIKQLEALELCARMERERDFNLTIAGHAIGMSSGTSGERGLFLVSKREQAIWAGSILAKVLHTQLWQHTRIGLFLRSNSPLYETVGSKNIQFCYFDLTEQAEHNFLRLQHFQPDVLVAPPSMLRLIAQAQRRGTVKIKPRQLIAGAEPLETIDRQFIAGSFDCDIAQIYQCTEGFLGFTCRAGQVHLCEDLVAVQGEPITGHQNKVIPVLTDFRRRAQPIIRYRLPDILTLSRDTCACQSAMQALLSIEGRLEDAFVLPASSGIGTVLLLPSQIIACIPKELTDDCEFQFEFVQRSPQNIEVYLSQQALTNTAGTASIAHALEQACHRQNALPVQLTFLPLPVRTRHELKLRRVRRDPDPNNYCQDN